MHPEHSHRITRRQFARIAAAGVAAVGGGLAATWVPRPAAAEEGDKLVTEFAANQPIIGSLNYVNESVKEGQVCGGCVLYTGPAEGLGKCALFQQGKVPARGWCQSWAPKPPTP